jgi:hypothetical protein
VTSSAGPSPADDYFDLQMVNRSRLLWAVATRRQLERWEPYVAAHTYARYGRRRVRDADIWLAQIEHHFALIAARNLIRVLELEPVSSVPLDPVVRAELIEGRDLHEHWIENLPVFNIKPSPRDPPRRSGKDFAARNPGRGPYWWLGWNNKKGAMLMPNVPAPVLHDLIDGVEAEVLATGESLARFIPPRAASPWTRERGEWWPVAEPEPGPGQSSRVSS